MTIPLNRLLVVEHGSPRLPKRSDRLTSRREVDLMKDLTFKDHVSIVSGVLGAIASILKIYEWFTGSLAPLAKPLIVIIILSFALAMFVQRDRIWNYVEVVLARCSASTRLMGWVCAIVLSVIVALLAGYCEKWQDAAQIMTLVTMVVVGLIVIERYSLDVRATTYLGPFPSEMPIVIEIIKGASKSIKALTDVIAYGAYRSSDEYRDLIRAIEDQCRKKVSVTWSAYSLDKAKQAVAEQFEFTKLERDPIATSNFLTGKDMHDFRRTFGGVEPKTIPEFLDKVLVKRQEVTLEQLNASGCSIQANIETKIPLLIWLVDHKVAVFSLEIKERDSSGTHAFLTRDPHVLSVLEKLGNLYWEREAVAASASCSESNPSAVTPKIEGTQ